MVVQASRQVAAALSSGNSEEVRQALRGAVMALSSSLNPSDSKEVMAIWNVPVWYV